jgi:hypothetical protein
MAGGTDRFGASIRIGAVIPRYNREKLDESISRSVLYEAASA